MKNVSCEYDRLNSSNSTLQAAWNIRHVRWTCLFYIISFILLRTRYGFCELNLRCDYSTNTQFHKKIVPACSCYFVKVEKRQLCCEFDRVNLYHGLLFVPAVKKHFNTVSAQTKIYYESGLSFPPLPTANHIP